MEEFGTCLRRLRQSRQWTLAELATRTGVSTQSLWNWERGRHEPSTQELAALIQALGLTPVEELRLTRTLKATRFQRPVQIHREVDALRPLEDLHPRPSLGDLLHALRRRKDLSRTSLAELMGVQMPTITRWEQGTRYPSDAYLERLLGILEAEPLEAIALRDRRLGSEPLAMLHLDALTDRVQFLEMVCQSPTQPLVDLTALALLNALWPHACRTERARHLLGRASVIYGTYLTYRARTAEATRYTDWAGKLLAPPHPRERDVLPYLLVIFNRMGAMSQKDPQFIPNTLRYLTSLPEFENASLRCYVQGAAANYAFRLGRRNEALALAGRAVQSHHALEEGSQDWLDRSPIVAATVWQEAVVASGFRSGWDLQPAITPETHFASALGTHLTAARLHLQGGSRATAEQHIRDAYKLIDEHSFENARIIVDRVARSF